MATIVVRYKTKPEHADENQQLVENVFAALNEMGDTGFALHGDPPRGRCVVRPPRRGGSRRGHRVTR